MANDLFYLFVCYNALHLNSSLHLEINVILLTSLKGKNDFCDHIADGETLVLRV